LEIGEYGDECIAFTRGGGREKVNERGLVSGYGGTPLCRNAMLYWRCNLLSLFLYVIWNSKVVTLFYWAGFGPHHVYTLSTSLFSSVLLPIISL